MPDYEENLRWLEANPAAIQELEPNAWRIQTRDGRTAGHVVSGGPAGQRCRAIALDNAWMLPSVAPHVAVAETVVRAAAYLLDEDLNPVSQPGYLEQLPVPPHRQGDPLQIGDFRIRNRLGQGGFGVVYLGAAPSGGPVAIKWLHAHLTDSAETVERMERAAALSRRVPAIYTARCLASGIQDDRPYIVTEYIEGPSLLEAVKTDGPRNGSALLHLATSTAAALASIHRVGIVHCGIKPGNVLLAPDRARVVDFELAQSLDMPPIIPGALIGTPAYMSPEQIQGQPLGPPADLFAWGATMAFAARGSHLFNTGGAPAIFSRVLHDEPDLADLPESLREVVAACLAKDPTHRPTAEQVVQLLGARLKPPAEPPAEAAAVNGPPSPARVTPPPGGGKHVIGVWLGILLLLGALILGLVAGSLTTGAARLNPADLAALITSGAAGMTCVAGLIQVMVSARTTKRASGEQQKKTPRDADGCFAEAYRRTATKSRPSERDRGFIADIEREIGRRVEHLLKGTRKHPCRRDAVDEIVQTARKTLGPLGSLGIRPRLHERRRRRILRRYVEHLRDVLDEIATPPDGDKQP